VLNVLGHYFLPALSTAFLNLVIIACALVLPSFFAVPVTALAVGVLLGGAVQLLLQWPALRQRGVRLRLNFDIRHPAVRRIATLMLPGLAGVAIYQINVVVSRLLASFLPEGSVSYLYYGQRLFEFPQGIFVVSLAQAVLPAMSRQAALGDDEGMKESMRFALALIIVITLPASLGLFLCAVPVYSLFFMGGAFSFVDVRQAALALAAYAPGLLFVGVSRVMISSFYARQDTRTPVLISGCTLLVNVVAGLLLMGPLQHTGLALAVTLSSVFNALALTWALRRKVGRLGLVPVGRTLARVVPAAVLMALVVWGVVGLGPWATPGLRWLKGLCLGGGIACGVAVYALGCLLFRVPEAAAAADLFRRKLRRRP
jgi:putative peptidoglycan lipid II flippase